MSCSEGIMKRCLIGWVARAGSVLGSSAFAANYDPAVRPDLFTAPPAFSAVRVYNWTGAYIGIIAGGGFGRATWVSTPDGNSGASDLSGALVGGTLGYNLQTGSPFVLGAESDVAWTSAKGTIPAPLCVSNCAIRNDWLATARLRFGYAIDGILPYATVGVSIARLLADITGTPLGTQSKNNLSWTAGAGVEFVIVGPWRAKLEYLYVDLGGISCDMSCGLSTLSNNLHEHVLRAGLNYRLWDR